jgi:hypothetical protein
MVFGVKVSWLFTGHQNTTQGILSPKHLRHQPVPTDKKNKNVCYRNRRTPREINCQYLANFSAPSANAGNVTVGGIALDPKVLPQGGRVARSGWEPQGLRVPSAHQFDVDPMPAESTPG